MKSALSPGPATPPAAFRLPRRPQGVVFDLDGTLIDSEALVLEAYFAAAERFDLPFTHQQFLSLVGHNRETSEARMRVFFGQAFPLEGFYAAVSDHVGERTAPLKPGAIELMDHLDRVGAPYALATSSGRAWVDKHFSAHELGGRFRAVVARQDVANGKPHPEPYLKAAAALGFEPAYVLAIEDSPTGVRSAHAAGLMSVVVPDLIQPDEDIRSRAHFVGASLLEVLEELRA